MLQIQCVKITCATTELKRQQLQLSVAFKCKIKAELCLQMLWGYLSVLKQEFEYIHIISPSELQQKMCYFCPRCSVTFPTGRQMGEGWGKQHQMLFFGSCTKWKEAVVKSMWEDFSKHSLFRVKIWEMIRIVFSQVGELLNSVPAQQVQHRMLKTTRSEFESQETHIIKSL